MKLFEVFDTKSIMYLVMEIMTGGELFDRIVEKEAYTEAEAVETIRPIIDAMQYCHEMGIIHWDLKPENLLYETKDDGSIVKIGDFGLAWFVAPGTFATTACGTPGYVAPEIIKGEKYGKEVDYWSIGIIIYILLCGFPPFYDDDNAAMFEAIKAGEFTFPSPYWDNISEEAKNCIKGLLQVDPS